MNIFSDDFKKELQTMLVQVVKDTLDNHISEAQGNDNDLISLEDAMKLTGFTRSTMYSKTCRREIPHIKLGRRLLFKRRELLEWIESGKRQTKIEMELEAEETLLKNLNRK